MPKMSVGFAMILLVAGNMIAVLSDALIKELPDELSRLSVCAIASADRSSYAVTILFSQSKSQATE